MVFRKDWNLGASPRYHRAQVLHVEFEGDLCSGTFNNFLKSGEIVTKQTCAYVKSKSFKYFK